MSTETERYNQISCTEKDHFRYGKEKSPFGRFHVFKAVDGFEHIAHDGQIIRVIPDTCKVVQKSKGNDWRIMHLPDFIRVKSTVKRRIVTSRLDWDDDYEDAFSKSKADYVVFKEKIAEFVERLATTPLHFYADCVLRSAQLTLELPWCLLTNYSSLAEEVKGMIYHFDAGENLKILLCLSHEIFSFAQFCHEQLVGIYSFSPPDAGRPFEEFFPWLVPSRLPPRSGYQFQYRFDAIEAPSSDLRPDLTSKILAWLYVPSFRQVPALLITGDGGVGKSTLLRSICRQFDDASRLHASFFFDAKHGRSDMARQLFKNVPADLNRWDETVIGHHGNYLKPRFTIPGNMLVVVDALDECEEHTRRELVAKLVKSIPRLPPNYRLLITSRDEDNLLDSLLSLPSQHLTQLDMNEVVEEGGLLTESLASTFGDYPWLGEVVAKSKGLPRFAATACRFILDGDELERLTLVRNLEAPKERPLYSLYRTILQFLFKSEHDRVRFQNTFSQIILSRMLLTIADYQELATFDSVPTTSFDAKAALEIGPLIGMDHDRFKSHPVQVLERSFVDFVTNSNESGLFYLDIDQPSHHLHILNQCLALLLRTVPRHQFTHSSLRLGVVSYAATLWPRHAVNSLRCSPEIAEQLLKPFVLRNLLYWAESVETTNGEFVDYIAHGITETPCVLLLDLLERLLSLFRSQSTESGSSLSFRRSFVANHLVSNICTEKGKVLYGRRELLCFGLYKWTNKVLFRWRSFVTCPAVLRIGNITLLACIRSSEKHTLQIRKPRTRRYGDNRVYELEALMKHRVVEMVAMEPHLVVVYNDGSMEQVTLSIGESVGGGVMGHDSKSGEYDAWDDDSDFWPDDSYKWPDSNRPEKLRNKYFEYGAVRRNEEALSRAQVSMSVEVPDCNYVKRVTALNPITSAVALTFNCGADGHLLLGPSNRHNCVCLGGEIVYWNCGAKSGHSLKLPPCTPPVLYMLFDRTQGMAERLEHLAAVTVAGSVLIWRIEGTESTLVGKFDPPEELNLPRLFAFEYYTLERPALGLISFKWEDGTVALYDAQLCSLLHWVKAKSALRVPWESLEVEEMNPEEIDPFELQLPPPTSTTLFVDLGSATADLGWFTLALLAYGLFTTLNRFHVFGLV